jgi:hypothetical protein
MLSRRDLVGRLAAGTAAVCAVGVAKTSLASVRRREKKMPIGAGHGGEGISAPLPQPAVDAPQAVAPAPAAPAPAAQALAPQPPIVDSGPPTTLSAPAPWELLRPLAMGSAVAHGWHVAGLTGAVDGSCVLTLENERGRAHRVHLCRNNGHPQGLVYTKHVDLVVMNGGVGDLPTEEGLAQAVAEVAHVLAANERNRRHEPVMTALLPHTERVRQFNGEMNRSLR